MKLLINTGLILLATAMSVSHASAEAPAETTTSEENVSTNETASDAAKKAGPAARGLAQLDLEPIEEDTYSLRSKRRRNKFMSLFHLVPYAGYLTTSWKGVKATAPSLYPYSNGSGGDMNAKDGYAAGVGVLVGKGQLQFESGLRYANRTVIYKGYLKDLNRNPMPYTGNITEEVSYVELPLLARFSFPDPSQSHFFVHGGIVGAMVAGRASNINNISYSQTSSYLVYTANPSAEGTLGELNSFDFRGLAGVGGEFKVSPSIGINVVGDYEQSFGKINSSGTDSITLQGFGIYAGVSFNL